MKDQHGNPVPDDLVTLPFPKEGIDPDILVAIMNATWYEANQVLLVSMAEVDNTLENDPLDSGIDLSNMDTITVVDDCLKRCDPTDGFHHA